MDEASTRRLLDGITSVAQDLSLPDVLRRIVLAAKDLAGADHGVLIERPSPQSPDPREQPAAYGLPEGDPPVRSFLAVPVLVRNAVFGTLHLAEKRGGDEFTPQDEELVVALAAAAGAAIENATLFERTRLRERWLAASHDVTAALLGGEDPADALTLIARRARDVSGASVGAIARPVPGDPGTLVFDVVEATVELPDAATGLTVSARGTATGDAFTTGKPVVIRDYGKHVAEYQAGRTGRLPRLLADLDSAVAVPLIVGDNTLGVLVVAKVGDTAPFGDEEVQLVRTFAAQAALALEFGRAARDRERLAVFEDRDRIAHDLHDLVIQRLFAIGLGLEGLSGLARNPRVTELVNGFVHDLDRTIQDIRSSIFSLQQPADAREGLRAELLGLALDAASALGFEPRVGFDGPLDTAVPPDIRPDVVAALREALTNTARHAGANAVSAEVGVDREGRVLTVTVTDDGRGPGAEPARRGGLANLAARARRWNGTLAVEETPRGGTTLRWTVPLPRPEG